MRRSWYGPLLDIAQAPSHIGYHIQLVALVLQCQPPQKVMTLKSTEVLKSMILVGDNTCSFFKVILWKEHACLELFAGDIIFLQNLKVTNFRGHIEATSVQCSEVVTLVKRHDLLFAKGIEQAVMSCVHGSATKEKLKLVVDWARSTQLALISFLEGASTKNIFEVRRCNQVTKDESLSYLGARGAVKANLVENNVRQCSSLAEVKDIFEPCLVEFYAHIGEICFPCIANLPGTAIGSHKWVLISKCLYGNEAQRLLKDLICMGCENCGSPLESDHNGVYAQCSCLLELPTSTKQDNGAKRREVKWIFRPFLLHIWDQSAQLTVSVKHSVALHLFANITAESVCNSLQVKHSLESIKQEKKQASQSCQGQVQHGTGDKSTGNIDFGSLLIILLRSMLRKGKNSPFHFRVFCCVQNRTLNFLSCPFDLCSCRLPKITPEMSDQPLLCS